MGKSKRTGKVSSGKRKAIRQARAEKRLAKFLQRREEGKAYEYSPNPFKKGTKKYYREKDKRRQKNVSKKLPFVKWKSIMHKLQNELEAQEIQRKQAMITE